MGVGGGFSFPGYLGVLGGQAAAPNPYLDPQLQAGREALRAMANGTPEERAKALGSMLQNQITAERAWAEVEEARRLAALQAAAERAERRTRRLLAVSLGTLFAVLSLFWWWLLFRAGIVEFVFF